MSQFGFSILAHSNPHWIAPSNLPPIFKSAYTAGNEEEEGLFTEFNKAIMVAS